MMSVKKRILILTILVFLIVAWFLGAALVAPERYAQRYPYAVWQRRHSPGAAGL